MIENNCMVGRGGGTLSCSVRESPSEEMITEQKQNDEKGPALLRSWGSRKGRGSSTYRTPKPEWAWIRVKQEEPV